VQGTKERMIALQRSPWHYFQRPDVSYVKVDSQATSLTGYAGRVTMNKEKGNWIVNSAVGAINPEFDSNDLGFISRSDIINGQGVLGYRWTKPTAWTQYAILRGATAGNWDFAGNLTDFQVQCYAQTNFPSNNGVVFNLKVNPLETVNNTRTRGGPMTRNRRQWTAYSEVFSDTRKPIELDFNAQYTQTSANERSFNSYPTIRFKPAPNMNITVGPTLTWSETLEQWVGAFRDPEAQTTYNRRYVFASLKYRELGASFRMNWTFTPRLSMQLFAQPLFSSGKYEHFKELSKPNSSDYREYSANDIQTTDGVYEVDPDGSGPATSFAFYNPDFNLRSLRSNLVVRWEYQPGSSLYFVWTHGRQDYEQNGDFDLNHSIDRLVNANPDDIFMVKATYWFSM
jgi:hypothetical protein